VDPAKYQCATIKGPTIMADTNKGANIARLVTKQAGRAKEKVIIDPGLTPSSPEGHFDIAKGLLKVES
jgi:hypothetical protein